MSTNSQVGAAYADCRRIAKNHYENFPVASYLVPPEKRDALAAIYAFARYADDVADEPGVERRLETLATWREKLKEAYAGRPDHPVFIALADAARKFGLSQEHCDNLIRAFELDVQVNWHPDFNSLLDYCRCSANPVGRLVLELFGHRDPELFRLSDNICTALQLANFWQDVAVDFERNRVYIPLDDMERFHYSLQDLAERRVNDPWRELMSFQVRRTWEHFDWGKALPEKVVPELRYQLRLTWLGGTTILKKIELVGFDVFQRRPALSRWDFLRLYLKARRGPLVKYRPA